MHFRPLAAALLCAAPLAQAQETTEPVIVTANRFQTTIQSAPVNVTVIDAAQIDRSGATNLADLLESQPNLHVADLLGANGLKSTIDMGGFGATRAENTLILLNSRRLNDVDLSGANLATIPLDSVERIEIMPGSGTVLYGDNATGGVINIVTKSAWSTPARVKVGAGSWGRANLSAQGGMKEGNDAFAATVSGSRVDGYRANGASIDASFAGEWSHAFGDAVGGLRADSHYEDVKLPGALSQAQFDHDPTQAGTFSGTAREQRDALEAFWSGPQFSGELTHSIKAQDSVLFGHATASLDTWSFTPRYTHQSGSDTFVAGVDLYASTLDTRSDFSPALNSSTANRDSSAAYAAGNLTLAGPWALEAGARVQYVALDVDDHDVPAATTTSKSRYDTLPAFDAGIVYRQENTGHSYLRLSDTFRFPVLDEIWNYYSGTISLLKPQHGRQLELGTRQPAGTGTVIEARVFDAELVNEIGFDSATYANVNFAATRHTGADLSARVALTDDTTATLGGAWREAFFRGGPNEGKAVPEIPRIRVTAALDHRWADETVHVETLYTGDRYFGDDFANQGRKMDGYWLLNTAWTHRFSPRFTGRFAIRNLTDEKAADSGFYIAPTYYYYPLPGRTFGAEVQASF